MNKKDATDPGLEMKSGSGAERLDDEIADDFAERQELARAGRQVMLDRLDEHHAKSPKLSAGDVDAAWDMADSGEETVGGHAPTPGQDVVDEIGAAAGLTYADDEPLDYGKVLERDAHRWELNPASDDDLDDSLDEDEKEAGDAVEDYIDVLDLIDDEDDEDDEDEDDDDVDDDEAELDL